MATSIWRIHSWQISVPLGDSAIHLLVDEKPKKAVVHSAVLIDGGKSKNKAFDAIERVMDAINSKYDFAENKNFEVPWSAPDKTTAQRPRDLRFDSIVITHWDSDHYAGVLELLRRGFQQTVETYGLKPTQYTKAYAAQLPNWYCKYSDSAQTFLPKVPSTKKDFLNFKQWDTPGQFYDEDELDSTYAAASSLKTTIFCPYSKEARWAGPHGTKGILLRGAVGDGKWDTVAKTKFDTLASITWDNVRGSKPYITAFARLNWDFNKYIGADLFEPEWDAQATPPRPDWTTIKTPGLLVNGYSIVSDGKPRLVVVAGHQRIIGDESVAVEDDNEKETWRPPKVDMNGFVTSLSSQATVASKTSVIKTRATGRGGKTSLGPFRRVAKVIDKEEKGLGIQPDVKNPKDDSIAKNAASIVALGVAARQNKDLEVLFYVGGDVLWDVENAIAKWLTPTGSKTFRIAMYMKLSHHGSRGTSSVDLLNALHPLYYIASCGIKGNFGHPSVETVTLIHAQREMWKQIRLSIESMKSTVDLSQLLPLPGETRPLLCTNFPVWANPKLLAFKANVDALALQSDSTSVAARFQDAVTSRYDGTSINILEDYQDPSQKLSGLSKIRKLLSDEWKSISENSEKDPNDPNQDFSLQAWRLITGVEGDKPVLTVHRLHGNGQLIYHGEKPQKSSQSSGTSPKKVDSNANKGTASNNTSSKSFANTTVKAMKTMMTKSGVVKERKQPPQRFSARLKQLERDKKDKELYWDPENSEPASETDDRRLYLDPDAESDDDSAAPKRLAFAVAHSEAFRNPQPAGASVPLVGTESAPALTTPVVMAAAVAAVGDAGVLQPFFIYANGVTDVETASDRGFLVANSPADQFIRRRYQPYIVVDRDPSVALNTAQTLSVRSDDTWFRLVRANGLGVQTCKLVTTIQSSVPPGGRQTAAVTAMSVTMTIGATEVLFDTSKATYVLSSSPNPNMMYMKNGQLLALGLNAAPATKFTLSTIIQLLGPPWLTAQIQALAPFVDEGPTFGLIDGPGSRNSLFFGTDRSATTILRLGFELTSAADACLTWLKNQKLIPFDNVEIKTCRFVCVKTGTAEEFLVNNEYFLSGTITNTFTLMGTMVINGDFETDFWLNFNPGGISLVLQFPDLDAERLFSALRQVLNIGNEPGQKDTLTPGSVKDLVPANDVSVKLHRIVLDIGKDFNCSATLEVKVFGKIFFTLFSFPQLQITAELWTGTSPIDQELRWNPEYESYKENVPIETSAMGQFVTITDLVKGSDDTQIPDPPDPAFLQLDRLKFGFSKAANDTSFQLTAQIALNAPNTDVPMIWPDNLSVYITGQKSGATGLSKMSWDFRLVGLLELAPRSTSAVSSSAYMDIEISKSSTVWTVSGWVYDLDFANLYQYFDADAQALVMDLLEGITVPDLGVVYTFGNGIRDLSITGTMQIKVFELSFSYRYSKTTTASPSTPAAGGTNPPSQSEWIFTASVSPSPIDDDSSTAGTGKAKLIDIIAEFVPGDDDSGVISLLRGVPFLSDIEVGDDSTNLADSPLIFGMQSSQSKAITMYLQMQVHTPAGVISVMFVQYKKKIVQGSTNGATTTNRATGVKRYLRVQLDHLPTLPKIPIVGDIVAPIDSLDYVFVQDLSGSSSPGGLTAQEVGEINDALTDLDPTAALRYKQASSDVQSTSQQNFSSSGQSNSTSSSASTVVLSSGHHFIVVCGGSVVLDYLFGGSASPTPKPSGAVAPGAKTVASAQPIDVTSADSGSTFGARKASAAGGLLSINNLGIQVKNKYVYILIDAQVMLGTIQMTIEGLGVGLPLSKILDPESITIDDFSIMLAGLGVLYDQPPILIAGGFKHEDTPAYESYMGGLMITIPPYAITAVGAYRHTYSPDFKSVFLFGRLDGPLFTLEFAEISGVAVSFGYNYSMRSPRGDTLQYFPLLSKQGPPTTKGNPLDVMIGSGPDSFSSWITAQKGEYFFSIGLKADAFQLLTIEAALVFEISADNVKISIVGRGTVVVPPAQSGQKMPFVFMYAELGIVATLDIGGSLMVEAQLSDNSFIMNPLVIIQGGFALCYWFGSSPFAGDWVFSVGGYHPAFKRPAYWPNPPRVGIRWQLSDVLRVGGEAYFAITPKAIMGGGRLYAVFQAGPIYADFEAWANFLINYKPFFFTADIGVSITVGFHVDAGLLSVDINGTISADLYLQGPPFGGYVRVDFKLVKVTIHFGDGGDNQPRLTLDQFIDAVRKPGLTDASSDGSIPTDPAGDGKAAPDIIVVALTAGAATESMSKYSQKAGDDAWTVRAGQFRFRVESKVAVKEADIYSDLFDVSTTPPTEKVDKRTNDSPNEIYARLTHSDSAMTSTLTVKITKPTNASEDVGQPWRLSPMFRSLPRAMWEKYSSSEDPVASSQGNNNLPGILSSSGVSDTTIPHLVGYNFVPPRPSLPTRNFPSFDVIRAMSEGVFQAAEPASTKTSKNPLIPPSADDVERRPRLPASADNEVKPALQEFGEVRDKRDWDAFESSWKAADDDQVQKCADLVAMAFGWAQVAVPPAPVAVTGATGAAGSTSNISGTAGAATGTTTGPSGAAVVTPAGVGTGTTNTTPTGTTAGTAAGTTTGTTPGASTGTTPGTTTAGTTTDTTPSTTPTLTYGLSGKKPSQFLLADSGQYYMSCPRVTAVSTAAPVTATS